MHRLRVSVMVGVALALGAISPSSTLAVSKPEVFGPLAFTTEGMRDLSRGVLRVVPWAPEGSSGGCLTAGATAWIDDPLASLPAACPFVAPIPFADAP